MGGPYFSRQISTVRTARSTPAQELRGFASRTRRWESAMIPLRVGCLVLMEGGRQLIRLSSFHVRGGVHGPAADRHLGGDPGTEARDHAGVAGRHLVVLEQPAQ